jgi:DNA-directed RNA polymerase specialized sigma24 family protein
MMEHSRATPAFAERHSDDLQWPADLVDLYQTDRLRLVRLAYLLTGQAAVAEELVQDAFIATRQAWSSVRRPGHYLQRAVVNRCRSWGRHQQVVKAHPPAPAEATTLEADELWDALNVLDERRRAALVLR